MGVHYAHGREELSFSLKGFVHRKGPLAFLAENRTEVSLLAVGHASIQLGHIIYLTTANSSRLLAIYIILRSE
jgi:hypothetical protein